jgi:hypothetical protein
MRSLLFLIILTSSFQVSYAQKSESLFNGKDLAGWDKYIGPAFDTVKNDWNQSPRGLNSDPLNVFSVVSEAGNNVIRISGEEFGGISTQREFENYHLYVEFKWGEDKYNPKKTSKRDSGVLYHAVGDHGADGGFWMRSQEFQVQEGDCGDYWGVAGGSAEIRAKLNDKGEYVYNANSHAVTFNEKSKTGRHCIKDPDAEKPYGEYNLIEIFCFNDTTVHLMNGKVVMVLYKSAYVDEAGVHPLAKGKIQIQSEGAEIFYKTVKVRAIKSLPKDLLPKTK